MTSKEFSNLPYDVRDAALRGLSSADDELGIPDSAEAILSDYESGKKVRLALGKQSVTATQPNMYISARAVTAPDATDHSKLGQYPDNEPPYIR